MEPPSFLMFCSIAMSFSFLEFFTRVNFTDVHRYATVDAAWGLEKTHPTQQIRYPNKKPSHLYWLSLFIQRCSRASKEKQILSVKNIWWEAFLFFTPFIKAWLQTSVFRSSHLCTQDPLFAEIMSPRNLLYWFLIEIKLLFHQRLPSFGGKNTLKHSKCFHIKFSAFYKCIIKWPCWAGGSKNQ